MIWVGRRGGILLSAVALACLGLACGSNFHTVDRVTRLDDSEICVTSAKVGSTFEQCAPVRTIDAAKSLAVGDCVEAFHAGESGRLLSIDRVVSCPGRTGGSTTTTTTVG